MGKSKKLIIGYFGYETNQIDGQTIKTRNIYELLSRDFDVEIFDTESLKNHKGRYVSLMLRSIVYKEIFYMGGQRNLKYFFPLLMAISFLFNKRIYYITIGGWLLEFINANKKFYTNALKNVKCILVESNILKSNLESIGFTNVAIIPNFRLLPSGFKANPELRRETSIIKIVFMARIMEEKGIFLIFDFFEEYLKNRILFQREIVIDFYGPIIERDKKKFISNIDQYEQISYRGILAPAEICSVLSQYDFLVLPTFYSGEGFPGTIADAYYSGIPVIASNWKQIPEFVEDGKSGFLIDFNDGKQQLFDKIRLLCNDIDKLYEMKQYALQKSKQYSADIAHNILLTFINK